MALENTDVFPIYRGSDPVPHRKASIGALLTRIGDIPTELSDLSDIDTFGVTDGQMLVWNDGASEWQPVDVPDGVDVSNFLEKPSTDGDFIVSRASGITTYSDEVDGGEYAT